MFTNWYKTSPITMGQMPLKGLAKARNQTITNTWSHAFGNTLYCYKINTPKTTWKVINWPSKSNEFQRLSNTMPNGSFVKRWDIKMNAYPKKSKERSKFVFGWNSIKESWFVIDKCDVWRAVSIDVGAEAMGIKALTIWTYFPMCPKVKLCPKQWV